MLAAAKVAGVAVAAAILVAAATVDRAVEAVRPAHTIDEDVAAAAARHSHSIDEDVANAAARAALPTTATSPRVYSPGLSCGDGTIVDVVAATTNYAAACDGPE